MTQKRHEMQNQAWKRKVRILNHLRTIYFVFIACKTTCVAKNDKICQTTYHKVGPNSKLVDFESKGPFVSTSYAINWTLIFFLWEISSKTMPFKRLPLYRGLVDEEIRFFWHCFIRNILNRLACVTILRKKATFFIVWKRLHFVTDDEVCWK